MSLAIRPKIRPEDDPEKTPKSPPRLISRPPTSKEKDWSEDACDLEVDTMMPMELGSSNEVTGAGSAMQRRKIGKGCVFPLCIIFGLLTVVVWDMNKVQQLSTIIHNDHAYLWIFMNESLISRMYSPMSLCILNAPESTLNTVEIRSSCAELNKKDKFPFCTVGYSFNKECLGSLLSEDSYYFKILRDPYYHESHENILSVLEQLARAKWSLLFVGDKVSLQSMNALICALDGLKSPQIKIIQNSAANFTIKWISSQLQVEIVFQILRAIKYSSSEDAHLTGEAIDIFNRNNGSSTTLEIVQQKIADQLLRFRGIVVLANVGSYYNNRVSFREDMPILMKYLNEVGKQNIAIFRESASQHWNLTRSGYYNVQSLKRGQRADAASCMPNADSSPNLDWRNRDALSAIAAYDLNNVDWIFFHDITAPLYNMHPFGLNSSSAADVDCTQYCYFPQMWQPIWVQLVDIIDRNDKILVNHSPN